MWWHPTGRALWIDEVFVEFGESVLMDPRTSHRRPVVEEDE